MILENYISRDDLHNPLFLEHWYLEIPSDKVLSQSNTPKPIVAAIVELMKGHYYLRVFGQKGRMSLQFVKEE